jgi:hypothetical protein
MTLEVRAEHTTTRLVKGLTPAMTAPGNRLTTDPAGPGEAHLVRPDDQTLCGRDAWLWALIRSPGWDRLGIYRCQAANPQPDNASG